MVSIIIVAAYLRCREVAGRDLLRVETALFRIASTLDGCLLPKGRATPHTPTPQHHAEEQWRQQVAQDRAVWRLAMYCNSGMLHRHLQRDPCGPDVYFKAWKGIKAIGDFWWLECWRPLARSARVILCKRMQCLQQKRAISFRFQGARTITGRTFHKQGTLCYWTSTYTSREHATITIAWHWWCSLSYSYVAEALSVYS